MSWCSSSSRNFSPWRAARLAGDHVFDGALAQPILQPAQMRAFAGAVDAFQGDEFAKH
jgi:hypothetical protein